MAYRYREVEKRTRMMVDRVAMVIKWRVRARDGSSGSAETDE